MLACCQELAKERCKIIRHVYELIIAQNRRCLGGITPYVGHRIVWWTSVKIVNDLDGAGNSVYILGQV